MSDKKVLVVGDVVYAVGYKEVVGRHVIKRTTATQAVSDKLRFKKEYSGWIRPVSKTAWDSISYQIETPELKEKLERQQMIAVINKTDFSKLTTEKLKSLLYHLKGNEK